MSKTNGTSDAQPDSTKVAACELSELEADINKLADLLGRSSTADSSDSSTNTTDDLESAAEADLMGLLAKLNNADGLAGEVEGKLDELLAKLDGMLGELEEEKEDDGEAGKGTG